MKAIYKKRLLNVAKALRESKRPSGFTMGHYCWTGSEGPDETGVRHPCGTPACALGHYAARGDLQKTFKLDPEYGDVRLRGGEEDLVWYNDGPVRTHFGLSGGEAYELFGGYGCGDAETAKQAARYIERFVARKEKEARK